MKLNWNCLFADRVERIQGSQIRNFFSLTESPEVISFAGGFPDSDLFPTDIISHALEEIVRGENSSALQYAPTEGVSELRSYLKEKMETEGINCSMEEVVITNGTQQGLDLLFKLLINPGDPVLVEEPTYIGGVSSISSYGGEITGISMDAQGLDPVELEEKVRHFWAQGRRPGLLYTIPNFQNPTGYTTNGERRKLIYEIASRYNFIIVEDNAYGELSYDQEVPPSYKSIDREGRVVYLGSYSKTFLPGIKVGWVVAPPQLQEKIVLSKQTADLCSASLGQHLASYLSANGFIDQHVKWMIEHYRSKRDTMIECMQEHFPKGISFTPPGGGFFLWVQFPESYPSSEELLKMALERKVAFVHGKGFFRDPQRGNHRARFSFSQNSIEEIEAGIRKLGQLFRDVETNRVDASSINNRGL